MPQCPNCLSEYRPGISRCPDCGAELAQGAPGEAEARHRPETELVCLCRVADPAEAQVIRAVLAGAGIQSLVRQHGPMTGELVQVVDGVTHDYALVYVTRNRLEEAREALDGARSAPVQWPEGMEPDESGDAVECD
jgi:hypothetical protein